jgi:hypothetical protein
MKSGRLSDESMIIKRKRIDGVSQRDSKIVQKYDLLTSNKTLSSSEPSKRPKTGIFFHRDTHAVRFCFCFCFLFLFDSIDKHSHVKEPQIHCIVHGCSNWAKSDWVYCSAACIRRHINDTLQAIQRSKGIVGY